MPKAFETIGCSWAARHSAQEQALGPTARHAGQGNEQVLSIILDDSVAEIRRGWELRLSRMLRRWHDILNIGRHEENFSFVTNFVDAFRGQRTRPGTRRHRPRAIIALTSCSSSAIAGQISPFGLVLLERQFITVQ